MTTQPGKEGSRNIPIKIRFWSRVDKSGGPDACWLWIGSKAAGYGQFAISHGVIERCHRLAYFYTHGYDSIPDGMFLCHKCDNPACCNPDHMFVGTPKENTEDCRRKGRHPTWLKKDKNMTIKS
jgi:hypothetical protein